MVESVDGRRLDIQSSRLSRNVGAAGFFRSGVTQPSESLSGIQSSRFAVVTNHNAEKRERERDRDRERERDGGEGSDQRIKKMGQGDEQQRQYKSGVTAAAAAGDSLYVPESHQSSKKTKIYTSDLQQWCKRLFSAFVQERSSSLKRDFQSRGRQCKPGIRPHSIQ